MNEETCTATYHVDTLMRDKQPEIEEVIKMNLFRIITDDVMKRLKNGEIAIKIWDVEAMDMPDPMETVYTQRARITEIVRCKDCKYYSMADGCCFMLSGMRNANPNGFCSMGKRDEQNRQDRTCEVLEGERGADYADGAREIPGRLEADCKPGQG